MNYLLDTNACIALMSASTNSVQQRFVRASQQGDVFYTSVVVAFELWYGVCKSTRALENTRRFQKFFAGPIHVLPFEDADATLAGGVRAKMELIGRPIGPYDLLVAGQALRQKMTLITSNVSEFGRVKGLLWEDWSK
jgi:tRNA(fMet)-specific endonuclease VapC